MLTRLLLGIVVVVGVLGTNGESLAEQPKLASQPPTSAKKLPDELDKLNTFSREMYAGARERELAMIPVVILVSGDNLVLRKSGKSTVANVLPAEYHALKCVAHTTLALYGHLSEELGRPLSEARLKSLKEFQTLVTAARTAVEKFGFDGDTLTRQQRLLARTESLTAKAIQDGKVSAADLTKFCRAARADVVANGAGAVRAQLRATHKQVMEWKKVMTAEDWSAITVIVPGVQTARAENAVVQYFARLFGETPGEGRRVVYAESLWGEKQALDLLGTLRLDSKIAEAVFGDRFRMYRDFLADGAREAIDEILAPE